MSPVSCRNCGVLFMNTDPENKENRECHTCKYRSSKPMVKEASGVKILLTVSQDEHTEIEELCVSIGSSLSEYFLKLHHENQKAMKMAVAHGAVVMDTKTKSPIPVEEYLVEPAKKAKGKK